MSRLSGVEDTEAPPCVHCGGQHADFAACALPRSHTISTAQAESIATQVVQNVCELPDYNSPDDQPELVMCTVTELHNCVMRALEALTDDLVTQEKHDVR